MKNKKQQTKSNLINNLTCPYETAGIKTDKNQSNNSNVRIKSSVYPKGRKP